MAGVQNMCVAPPIVLFTTDVSFLGLAATSAHDLQKGEREGAILGSVLARVARQRGSQERERAIYQSSQYLSCSGKVLMYSHWGYSELRSNMVLAVSAYAFAAACLAYLGFSILLAVRGGRTALTLSLVVAGLATSAWAASEPLARDAALIPAWAENLAAAVRDGSWLLAILTLLYRTARGQRAWLILAAMSALVVAAHILLSAFSPNLGSLAGVHIDSKLTGIAMTTVGLVLVENLLRNAPEGEFWSIKHFVIGVSALLGFQALARFPEFLTHKQNPTLDLLGPLVFVVVLPLFTVSAIRIPALQLRIHSSRSFVFHSAALLGMGILLQGTAVAAYYVRNFGGNNATVLAILLGFAGVVGTAAAASSASVRSRLRTFINENFFSYKYDYRVEWERFIHSLSAQPELKTADRVLRTLAAVLDSTGGVLWTRRENWRQFLPVARWAFPNEAVPLAEGDPLLAAFGQVEQIYLETASDAAEGANWRQRYPAAWLVVPLRYRSQLAGIVVLAKPRAPRRLDWEDRALIRLITSQLAAYLVQEEMAETLADARQLDEFNKRFSFIVHDVKNTIGQLNLLVGNAEKFGHQREFQEDMVATLRHSVQKLGGLLEHLRPNESLLPAERKPLRSVDLTALVSQFVERKRKLGLEVVARGTESPFTVEVADPEAIDTVLEHVISNAVEASPPGTSIGIKLSGSAQRVLVAIEDKGRGMTQEFIAHELFRPLRTTKCSGFGIGAFQVREIMRSLGGDILVESAVGRGTTVTLSLPVVQPVQAAVRA